MNFKSLTIFTIASTLFCHQIHPAAAYAQTKTQSRIYTQKQAYTFLYKRYPDLEKAPAIQFNSRFNTAIMNLNKRVNAANNAINQYSIWNGIVVHLDFSQKIPQQFTDYHTITMPSHSYELVGFIACNSEGRLILYIKHNGDFHKVSNIDQQTLARLPQQAQEDPINYSIKVHQGYPTVFFYKKNSTTLSAPELENSTTRNSDSTNLNSTNNSATTDNQKTNAASLAVSWFTRSQKFFFGSKSRGVITVFTAMATAYCALYQQDALRDVWTLFRKALKI